MSNSNANNLNNDSSNNGSQTTVVIPPFLSDAQNLDEATLTNKFKQLHINDQERLRKAEDQVNKYSMSVALDTNVSRFNRYSNVLPFNYNRVKLIRKRPGRTDDYINASYIRAPYDVKKYIVTQGPMKNTLEDFWLMIWEQNSRVIVMLTKEQEKNIIKCDKYWPDFGSPVIYKNAGLKVELEKEDLDPSTTCVIRTIRIEKIDDYFYSDIDLLNNNINSYSVNGGFGGDDNNNNFIYNRTINNKNFIRRVTQLHFVGWPDHGVPDSPENILNLIRKTDDLQKKYINGEAHILVNNNNNINNIINNDDIIGPIVVHCSAGCGRTGTFCTIDSTLALLENNTGNNNDNNTDLIQDLVGYFREQRVIMVQTLGQFQYCYLAVLSNLVSKRTTGGS